jgi:hypothetical protein
VALCPVNSLQHPKGVQDQAVVEVRNNSPKDTASPDIQQHRSEYSSPPVSAGDTFQDLPRMPETADSSEPYI